MEDKMYIFYLKTNRTVCVLGNDFQMEYDKIIVIKDREIIATFVIDNIEGFIVKDVEGKE
jgi:hypothetical protein